MVQYVKTLDSTFGALADPTRRAILQHLGRRDASIGELAERFDMTMTGAAKHVRILETAKLARTVKIGRTRVCSAGPRRLEDVAHWITSYREMLEIRLDHLEHFLAQTMEQP